MIPIRHLRRLPLTFVLLLLLSASCDEQAGSSTKSTFTAPSPHAPSAPPWFEDATLASGLDFVHDAGPPPAKGAPYFMPQVMGSGAALFDCDNDGRLDAYLLTNAGPASNSTNRLFRQRPDGTFADATA